MQSIRKQLTWNHKAKTCNSNGLRKLILFQEKIYSQLISTENLDHAG